MARHVAVLTDHPLLRDRPLSAFSTKAGHGTICTIPIAGERAVKKFIKARMKVPREKRHGKVTLKKKREAEKNVRGESNLESNFSNCTAK